MPAVTFVDPDGTETRVEATEGTSVMEAGRQAGLDGIVAECGGSMACATCHVYVHDDWIEKTGTATDGETDMLDFAACEPTGNSRLSCQIKLTDALDGLVVRIPEAQV